MAYKDGPTVFIGFLGSAETSVIHQIFVPSICCLEFTTDAAIDSVMVPIWLILSRSELQAGDVRKAHVGIIARLLIVKGTITFSLMS